MFGKRKPGSSSLANAARVYQEGLAAYETGRYCDAIAKLSALAEDRSLPGTLARFYLSQAHLQQGISELNGGNYAVAARHFSESRRINPDSAGLSNYLTACHVGQGRFDLAAAEIERARVSGDADQALPIRLAYAFLRDGQYDRAVDTLMDAIAVAPRRADLRFQIGVIQCSAGDYEAAIESLESAARLAPFDPAIHQHLGLAFGAIHRARDAVRHLRSAQRLAPHDAHTSLLLAMALDAAGQSGTVSAEPLVARPPVEQQADLETLARVIVQDPDFVEAFLSLPESQVDRDIFAMLAGTLERALERYPDYADLHYHCSRVYHRLGRTDAAIDKAREAVRINPRYVQALIQLGRLYAQTDRDAEAIDRLRMAIDGGGDYPDVHYLLGELHRKGGRREQACRSFRRALELNAKYERAREALNDVTAV